jgi:hypothetical protein
MCPFYNRGTNGGCFATSLGGLIHELGHMLDLGHTENGMMARGCDDIDKFFSLAAVDSKSSDAELKAKQRQLLANCSRQLGLLKIIATTLHPGGIRSHDPKLQSLLW